LICGNAGHPKQQTRAARRFAMKKKGKKDEKKAPKKGK